MMRIYVLFTDEPVFHPKILHELVLARRGEIVGVGGVQHRRAGGRLQYIREQLAFWGPKGFLVNALAVSRNRALGALPLPTSPNRPRSLWSVCAPHGIPFWEVADVNDPA